MLIGLEAYNYFINCTAVQLMIFRMKTNKMADRYLNTNSNFVMLIINNHAMLLVQLGINSTRGVWKFCQIGLAPAARPIMVRFPNTTRTINP